MGKYDILFTPKKIGSMEVKNRFVMVSMGGTHVFNHDGSYDKTGSDYLIERAKGGVGLLLTGATIVAPMGTPHWLHEQKAAFMQTRKMTGEVHKYGAKIMLQLSAGSGRTFPGNPDLLRKYNMDPDVFFVAPSDGLPNVWNPKIKHRALSTEEVYQYIHSFVESAKMAQEAGFDGIELHAVHEGYLMDQFTIEATNSRTDEFGGNLENRLRFPCEIIRRVKKECGEDFVVTVRYSVASKMKGFNSGALPGEAYKEFGRSLEESPAVARMLEAAGCDALNADNGSYDSWYWPHPPVYMPKGCNVPESEFIKRFVDIPVICAGRLDDPDLAAKLVSEGRFDFVGIARAFLADPDYVNKVEKGDIADIRPCIACHNGCLAKIFVGQPLTCAVNPAVFREEELRIVKTGHPKKVAVIGGGVAGMEAARITAERGHKVSLYEKTDELGGVFIAAAAPDFKEADKQLIEWYKKRVRDAGVDVHMNTEASPESVKALNADVVIMATGAEAKKLPVKGIENAVEAIDYLRGRKPVGGKVAVIGGGLTGCEIAYNLAKEGKTPVIIEMMDGILKVEGLCPANKIMLLDLLNSYNVEVHVNAMAKEITDKGVTISENGTELFIPADSVVSAAGYDSYCMIAPNIYKDIAPEVYAIGDCKCVGNLLGVVKDAYDVAFNI
ncbi:MAG TPA: FAD-dependent oxidoreductase [Feifaniaceae bacterium]|nr:FAD-dependent oxidoreductase [Feifaniaceae bacterium]